jgi:hypothetical protein
VGYAAAFIASARAVQAALQGRADAAAQLLRAADARYAAADETRQINEARGQARVLALCTAAWGASRLQQLRKHGRALPDAAWQGLAAGLA